MDAAYNQHSPYSRHTSSRSHTNLNHLTLAPLTSRLPLSDPDALPDLTHRSSYIEGRSAPTTPSILSHSSSRVSLRKPMNLFLTKSKSSTHLLAAKKQPRSGATTPGGTRLRNTITTDELDLTPTSATDGNNSDWLLRAGAMIASSTRESKGQAWLVSRASSTSLTGQRDEDEEALEMALAREREQTSRITSRRGSAAGAFDADDEFSPITTRRSLSFGPATGTGSRPTSRFGSRVNSRRGSRAQLLTPIGGEREGYFDHAVNTGVEYVTEPDFVNVEEEIYEEDDDTKNDDAEVRKLARSTNVGLGGLVERLLGWSLFAVEEDGEDEADSTDEKANSSLSSKTSQRDIPDEAGVTNPDARNVPPPQPGEDGEVAGWQDAAWLLSVATKVLL